MTGGQSEPVDDREAARNKVAALESILLIAQHQDSSTREASSATRSSIATVLGFDGVLIGLAAFAAGNIATGDGALAGSSLVTPFAISTGASILALAVSALVLLVTLIKADHVMLTGGTQHFTATAREIEKSDDADPVQGLILVVEMLMGEGMIVEKTLAHSVREPASALPARRLESFPSPSPVS